ncbi:MAG: AbrB/MazE/SpoVT family DNA-binding domain-containing protein [Sphingomonadaceae bacterium]
MYTEVAMTEERSEWQGKTFKSGNSVALRLPKGLGVPEGVEVKLVREAPMSFRFEPIDAPKRKIDVDSFWGKAAGMVHVPTTREDFEPRPSALRSER